MSLALPIFETVAAAGKTPPVSPSREVGGRPRLIDSRGRTIRDLRLSITDRCNFRCVYCMEPDVKFMPREELLSVEEMVRLVRVCVGMGVEKVRLTGGEPTVHPKLTEIIGRLAAEGVGDLAMTTNGSLMDPESLAAWKAAGLTRLTVSLDSVHPDRFAAITRSSTSPGAVIQGVRDAIAAGFAPVKVNAVVVRGFNEDEVVSLAELARELSIDVRFIEFMPLDSAHAWDPAKLVPADEIVQRIGEVYPLVPIGRDGGDASSTSLVYRFADGAPGIVGVIAPVTRPFCGACSRLRITSDGKVRPCLFSLDEFDLRPLLRDSRSDDAAVAGFLSDATWTKQAGHGITAEGFKQPDRPMSAIGG